MSPITNWGQLAEESKKDVSKFEPAPEGNYNMTVTEASKTVAKDSGNTKFDVTLVIDSGPCKGKKLWHSFTVATDNKKAMGIFFRNMEVFGMPFDFFNANTSDESIVQNILGKRISADLVVDNYNPDKPKNKIDKGWTIKNATGPAELDVNASGGSGVPGGAYTNGAPPVQTLQQAPPIQQVVTHPNPDINQQYNPPQYQEQYQQQAPPPPAQANPNTQYQQPQAAPPPPPPSGSGWGAPPPPPPGL